MRSIFWNQISEFGVWGLVAAFTVLVQGCTNTYVPPPIYVLYTNPPPGVKAPVNTLIGAVFDCDIYSIKVEVVDSKGNNVYGRLTVDHNYFSLKPYRNLHPCETYTVIISDVHALEDTASLDNYSFSFETSDEIDETPPRIIEIVQIVNVDGSTKHLPLDTLVDPDGGFDIIFSEPIFRREFNPRTVGIYIEPEVAGSMIITFVSPTEACLDISELLEETTYKIKFSSGFFWDLAGNNTSEYFFTFHTGKRKKVKKDD